MRKPNMSLLNIIMSQEKKELSEGHLVGILITDANLSFVDIICDTYGSLVAHNCFTKKGQAWQYMKDQFVKEIKLLQML